MFFIKKESLLLVCLVLLLHQSVSAQIDSLNQLQEVKVTASPQQKATTIETLGPLLLEKLQALQVSDAVKHFSGVIVKDYGGIGGLKTVSVRGLGATHTGVSYDGITINDAQTGQIDIGKFSMDNIESISLTKGSPDDIFQPARIFSSATLLSIKTLQPQFKDNKFFKGKFSLKTGSFGLINPAFLIQNKLGKIYSSSINAEWQKANGKYPFLLENGSASSKVIRGNTDIESFRGEGNLFANFNERYKLLLKTTYFQSERGLPGPTILYSTESLQRLWDRNFFVQTRFEAVLTSRLSAKLDGKYYNGYQKYLDPSYQGMEGKIENVYYQKEGYLSASAVYKISETLQFSAASDWIYNTMKANLNNFAYPARNTFLSVVNGKWENNHLSITGCLLSTIIKESVKEGEKPLDKERYSPTITLGYKPGKGKLLLRFFYKDIFRLPTFNDLYYTGIGNTDLKPESSQQFNLGITYLIPFEKGNNNIYLTADFYHNRVSDKIVALPSRNLFIWSMINLGKVEINGADVSARSEFTIGPDFTLLLNASYTFQHVLDVTNSSSKTYRDQVAYTPVHSGSGLLGFETKWVNINYNIIFSGSRYMLNQNIPANYLNGYSEHGISASKSISFGKVDTGIKVDLLNMFNSQYEVVKNFPMPGRSLRLTLTAKI